MKNIVIFVVGLICGTILMGVATGENTTEYLGQMSEVRCGWLTIQNGDEPGYVERQMEKQIAKRGMKYNDYRLIERTCTEKVLRTWNRQ